MNREITKAPYCKPAIRVVEWDFNENICNSVITNSFDVNSCIKLDPLGARAVFKTDKRSDRTGEWDWTGSR
jgi:hypothetical protein